MPCPGELTSSPSRANSSPTDSEVARASEKRGDTSKYSLRTLVFCLTGAGTLLCGFGFAAPLQLMTVINHHEMDDSLQSTFLAQQAVINGLIHRNITGQTFCCLLNQVAGLLKESVSYPANHAVEGLWRLMKAEMYLNSSWNFQNEESRRKLFAHSFLELSEQQKWRRPICLSLGTGMRSKDIRAHVSSLYAIYANGQVSKTSFVEDEETGSVSAFYTYSSGEGKGWDTHELDLVTGKMVGPSLDSAPHRPTFAQLRILDPVGDSSTKVKASWSQLHRLNTHHVDVGLSRAAPIAHCGNYSCVQGVIASDISIGYVSYVVSEAMQLMSTILPRVNDQTSSIFIVNQHSRPEPHQAGILVGASDFNGRLLNGSLVNATAASKSVVRLTSLAILIKFGSWQAQALQKNQMFTFRRSALSLAPPQLLPCIPEEAILTDDCLQVGIHGIHLGEETRWLAVMVLPLNSLGVHEEEIEQKAQHRMEAILEDSDHLLESQIGVGIAVFVAIFFASLCLAGLLSCVFLRPLQHLSNLDALMTRLGEFDSNPGTASDEMKQLMFGSRSSIREVSKLQDTFCQLFHSVESFTRFLPKTIVRGIVRKSSATLNVTRREVTIAFSDIRGFTKIAEELSQEALQRVLRRYLSVMTKITEDHGGEVAEILGDGMLMFWNTPDDVPDHAALACEAALVQQEAVKLINEELVRDGLPELSIRVGVHTGTVLSGLIGSHYKMKFGCIGDAVNLASRMEGLCQFFGAGILCSGSTWEALKPESGLLCRKLASVTVKGKSQPTDVYEVILQRQRREPPIEPQEEVDLEMPEVEQSRQTTQDTEQRRANTRNLAKAASAAAWTSGTRSGEMSHSERLHAYGAALQKYEAAEFPVAEQLLRGLLARWPKDRPALLLLDLVMRGPESFARSGPVIWTGLICMAEK